MDDRHAVYRLPLALIVVVMLSLLAFLPLAIIGRGPASQPVQSYSTGNQQAPGASVPLR